jgi:hypothetical protein
MATVIERVHRLLALAESPNEHEARNAAVQAARLIRQHKITLLLPESPLEHRATPPPRQSPAPRQPTPAPKRRTPASNRAKRIADVPTVITSPLGGDCIECGGRYRAGSTIYWLASGGGIHGKCVAGWTKKHG